MERLPRPEWSAVARLEPPAIASRLAFAVRVREATPDGRLALPALADLCQEAAAANAAGFGEGLAETMARGVVWVLNRLRIVLARVPRIGETVTVETWPGGLERRGAVRPYRLGVEGDGVVGAAVSVWSLFDLERRRPVADPAAVLDRLPAPGPRVLPTPTAPPPGVVTAAAAPVADYAVHSAQLDVYGHVNHTHLIAWCLGDNGPQATAPLCPRDVVVAFRDECRPGARVAVFRHVEAAPGPGGAPDSGVAVRSALATADGRRELARAVAWYDAADAAPGDAQAAARVAGKATETQVP